MTQPPVLAKGCYPPVASNRGWQLTCPLPQHEECQVPRIGGDKYAIALGRPCWRTKDDRWRKRFGGCE